MPNALGTTTPVLVVQRALELVFTKRPLLSMVALNTRDLGGGMAALWNQQVISRILNIPAVNNFGSGAVDTAYTDVPVTINQFKEVHMAFTPQEVNGTSRDLVDEVAEPAAVAIANHLVDAVAANWVAGNFANSTTVANGWNYSNTMIPVRNALAGRGVPESGWFFAVNSAVYGALLSDTTIVAALNNPANAEAIRTGKLPQVAGLMPIEYPAIPNGGNMVGFAGTKNTVVLATRVPKSPEEIMPGVNYPGTFEVVTEPTTGLSVVLNKYVGQADLKANYRILLMYGTAKGNGNNGQILKTA